jgi:hypothetical protein
VLLQAGVGVHAVLQITTVGERSHLLPHHGDGKMRLSCHDPPLAGFATAGVPTLAPDDHLVHAAPPALLAVADQLACVWPTAGGNGGFFQRFRADTGAALDATAISLLFFDGASAQPTLAWNGSRFAFCGVLQGANVQLRRRQIDNTGAVLGAAPVTVLAQAAEIRDPCLVWGERAARYTLAWCDARSLPGDEVWMQFLDAQAAPLAAAASWDRLCQAPPDRLQWLRLDPDGGPDNDAAPRRCQALALALALALRSRGETACCCTTVRQQRRDGRGVRIGVATDMALADGVAEHDGFQFVNGESRSIAVYHRAVGADMRMFCRRFVPTGAADDAEQGWSAVAGEARAGVLARRPTAVARTQREYGAAWQYRANAAARFEIRFSRLDRQGRPMATARPVAPLMPCPAPRCCGRCWSRAPPT